MRDKTDQIIKAAIKVFIQKGFLQSTTQEIAKEANVAEVTLFRKFSTKQNLFETVIKKSLEYQFQNRIAKWADEETSQFFSRILDDRLEAISKNHQMVKMLITESLMGHLTNDLDFPTIIYEGLRNGIQLHFDKHNISSDAGLFAQQIAGILVSNVLFIHDKPYHKLTNQEKQKILSFYTLSLQGNL